MDGQPSLDVVSSAADLDALASEWDGLVRAMARPSPFLLHGWVTAWWRQYGAGAELATIVARRDGRPVGVVPAYIRRSHGVRVARFLGGHESALADVLLAPDEPASTAQLLVDELRRQPFDFADFFGLPGGSVLASAGGPPLIERVDAPVLEMPDGWDALYTARVGSKKRSLHRRRLRQLGEVGPVEFVAARTGEELEPLLEDAFRLHELRWRGRPDASTFGTDGGRVFHREALRSLAGQDVLRLVMMRVGGAPAAFHYFFALDGVMVVHRLAFDPALASYSPGLVATLETLRRASEEGLTKVEFLGGGERYKMELADRREPLYQGIGLGRSPLGALAARQRVATIQLRKTLKRSERLQHLYANGLSGLRRRKPV